MTALSEEDLLYVRRFLNTMQEALQLTESRRMEQQAEASGRASSQPSTKNSSSVSTITAEERRVWAETATVFWHIAGTKQTYVLSNVAPDACHALCRMCDGLLDYIHETLKNVPPTASSREVMECASSLNADNIFFLMDAFCSLKSCINIMCGVVTTGRDLHTHFCRVLVQQQHFRWMTRVFCAFCDEARQVYMENGEITSAFVVSVHAVLQCLSHCCTESALCAGELMYTEPRPLVADLLYGLRLRIATTSLVRPRVRDNTFQCESAVPVSQCSQFRGRELAEYLATGRMNAYDKVNKTAVSIAVAAVEKASAYESPAVTTALCVIIELSSRVITPSHDDSVAEVAFEVQVAMYENVLTAWDALYQLLQLSHERRWLDSHATSCENTLQHLRKCDLAGCAERILRHCQALVDCEPAFFRILRNQCTPFVRHSKMVTETMEAEQAEASNLIYNVFREGDLAPAETLHSSVEPVSAPPKSTQLRQPNLPRNTPTTKSLWHNLWSGLSRGGVAGSTTSSAAAAAGANSARIALSEEHPTVSPGRNWASGPMTKQYGSSLLSPVECGEEWWYGNESYVKMVRTLTKVLNSALQDVGTQLSLRLSICHLLSQITMRSYAAFCKLDGCLVVRSFLSLLRCQERRLQLQTKAAGIFPPGTITIKGKKKTVEGEFLQLSSTTDVALHGAMCLGSSDEGIMHAAMVQRSVVALWQTYYVLKAIPVSDEVIDLVELPLLLLRWIWLEVVKTREEEAEVDHASGFKVQNTLNSLFAPALQLWCTALMCDENDEVINVRSHEVFMELLGILLLLGTVPAEGNESLGAAASSGGGVILRSGNSSFPSSGYESVELGVPHGSHDDTVSALCDIFTILSDRNPLFFSSADMLRVFLNLLRAESPWLSKLGSKCIAQSLKFHSVYEEYATVIHNMDSSLLLHLLPLFSEDLVSSTVPASIKHERRTCLFDHGCVNAVVSVLECVLLSPQCVVEYPRLIQQIFRFLSFVESSHGGRPNLLDTHLLQVFTKSLLSLDRVEYFVPVAQAVIDAATFKYDNCVESAHIVRNYGPFSLFVPNCLVEKPLFIELIPPLMRHEHRHAMGLESDLLTVVHLILKTTTRVHSDAMLQWVLETKHTMLLPYLDVELNIADHQFPYVGSTVELQSFWMPILQEAPERSELRFNCTGGIVLTIGQWPGEGFSISAYFRFEEIYSTDTLHLFEFFTGNASFPPFVSICISDGDCVCFLHGGKMVKMNEGHALHDLLSRKWAHFLVVMGGDSTITLYLNARRIGSCLLPYFQLHSEAIIHIGLVNALVQGAVFSIGDIVLWEEELTAEQVGVHFAGTEYHPNICKMLACEVPREASGSQEVAPLDHRIACFVPYEYRDVLLLNVLPVVPDKYPIVAKLVGNYTTPPTNWIDYRNLFLSRDGLMHLLEWIGHSTTVAELQQYTALACECIRSVTNGATVDFRTYALFCFHLRQLAHFITPEVCDNLLHLASEQMNVDGELHPFIINRLVFDHILRDVELLAAMPLECAIYITARLEEMFTVASCPFARRNANYIVPFRFIDSLLNGLVYAPVSMPFTLLSHVISCVKHIMIACDYDLNILHAIASTAAVLTPVDANVVSVRQSSQHLTLPRARFACIRASLRSACDITILILRNLVECSKNSKFIAAFGRIVDLNWFVVCVSRFADASCVVYATWLFFEALQSNTELCNDVRQHPATVVAALAPHSLNEDLLLLLLGLGVGVAKRADLVSSRYSLLKQLEEIMSTQAPSPNSIAAPIFSKVLTLHLNAFLLSPYCFRPFGVCSVMQRRRHYSFRLYRYFSFVRVCSRLMLSLYVKRLAPRASRTVTEASIPFVVKESEAGKVLLQDSTPLPRSSRFRAAMAVILICVRFWRPIQVKRYKKLLLMPNRNAAVPLVMQKVEADGILFCLHVLRRLSQNSTFFASLTLSPYQIVSLAVFGSFLQREEVMAKADELRQAQWKQELHTDDVEKRQDEFTSSQMKTSGEYMELQSFSLSPLMGPAGNTKDDDEAADVDVVGADAAPQLLKSLNSSVSSVSTTTECCVGDEFRRRRSSNISSSMDGGTAAADVAARNEHVSDDLFDSFSGCERCLSNNVEVPAVEDAGNDDVQRKMRGQVLLDTTLGSIEQLKIAPSSVTNVLRKTAVDVLRWTIVSSLHTLPNSTKPVDGRTYGSCGELLFQIMLLTGATSGTEGGTATATHFFMHQVLQCVKMHEDSLESLERLAGVGAAAKTRLPVAETENSSDDRRMSAAFPSSSALDAFFLNVCGFNDLLLDFLSFNMMELSTISPYFVSLLTRAPRLWPHHALQQLRCHVVKICIVVLNRPSVQEVSAELMKLVYLLLTRALCPQWIMKDMLECLFRVLLCVYLSPPPSFMDAEKARRRKQLVVLCLRHTMRTYNGSKELRKSLSTHTLRQRFSLYKDFAAALLAKDESVAVAVFDLFCHNNMAAIDMLMSGRLKTKAEAAFKLLLKSRNEYINRIKLFSEAYTKVTELTAQKRVVELVQAYNSRFVSHVGSISPLKLSQVHWLVTYRCSFEQVSPHVRVKHYMDSRRNNATMVLCDCTSTSEATTSLIFSAGCCGRLDHVSALVPPFPFRCRPYLVKGSASFVDPRSQVSHSAMTLLQYLLEPNEVLRFISNGFRVNGIHTTPCLILLTNTAIKLLSFSCVTEAGDIFLCQYENGDEGDAVEQLSHHFNPTLPLHQGQRQARWMQQRQYSALSFALSMTNKLQKFLTDGTDGGGGSGSSNGIGIGGRGVGKQRRRRRHKRDMEAHSDGTKVAQSVRQATGHSLRDLFWVYPVRTITSVRMAHYMHQDTALLFDFVYDDGLMLSIVDAQQSMNTRARDEFLSVLKEVVGAQQCEFHEHTHRSVSIRSMLIRWAAGSVSTFDYLAFLNLVAGRTLLDLNQYPVYPWVLADYKSSRLALDSPASYRDLSFPMGAQTDARRQAVKRLYTQMMEMQEDRGEEGCVECSHPFHHGTHYSTSGGVLYYLIRVEPFTTLARIFQGGCFDVASRLFDSVEMSFHSCITGPADCKELTPEFFYDGRFLVNENQCNFGEKSDGSVVNDVKLPPWAKGSTQVFTAIMRYVLESLAVVDNIHRWIDLIFGVRRRGRHAVESYNVFQRMTYGEVVVRALKESHDPHEIDVIIAEVDNFGQTPMQLFQERHPAQRELKPTHYAPSSGGGTVASGGGSSGGGSGSGTRTGNTYTTAFHEQLPKVHSMIIHALDAPQMSYMLEDPAPGSFQAPPLNLSKMFRTHESAILDFVTMRSGVRMCCFRHFIPVDDTDYAICWSEGEHMLLRFDALSGRLLSLLRHTSAFKAPMSVSAICVSRHERVILMGSNNGTVYCINPASEDDLVLLSSTLCHHINPIAGFSLDTRYGRVISFTTSGTDCPIVWCVHRFRTTKLHRLDTARVLPRATSGERVVVAAAVDRQSANSIIITRRHLMIFDRHGEPYGIGEITIDGKSASHVRGETGTSGSTTDVGQQFVASMTAVTTYDTLEWSSGTQLLITGHQDGSLSLWRAMRLPPDKIEHGHIVQVQYHGLILDGKHSVRLGAITAIRQERQDVPVFLVGYHNGVVKVLRFENHFSDTARMSKS